MLSEQNSDEADQLISSPFEKLGLRRQKVALLGGHCAPGGAIVQPPLGATMGAGLKVIGNWKHQGVSGFAKSVFFVIAIKIFDIILIVR